MANTSKLALQLDRALKASLFLFAFAAPISIAATQTAWSFALLFWIIRAFVVKPRLKTNGLDLAVIAFVGLTALSSAFSYEPQVSLRKLASVSLVTIVYLFAGAVRDAKMLKRIVTVILISGVFTVAYTLGTLAVGKNLKVRHLTSESPLRSAGVQENDTILTANGKSVNSPDELADAVNDASVDGVAKLKIYRYEFLLDYDLPVSSLSASAETSTKFGITDWSRGRDTRAAGFYGHYTTYAEALQLILSLSFGLLIIAPGGFFSRNRVLLALAVVSFCIALFLTVTRASWAGFLVSAAAMILIGTTKRTLLICLACAIPIALAGIFYLQQQRNVTFIDTNDGSTTWRMTVWREGFGVLISNPRHLAVGIGMDSLKTHWQDWHMFDNGNLPMGHMHSTPLQLAFERGVPVLIVWIVWMFLYIRMLWRGFRRKTLGWFERGVLLGALGGTLGFLAGGLVHYNWGDSEVAMIFYLLMGLSLAVLREIGGEQNAIDSPV